MTGGAKINIVIVSPELIPRVIDFPHRALTVSTAVTRFLANARNDTAQLISPTEMSTAQCNGFTAPTPPEIRAGEVYPRRPAYRGPFGTPAHSLAD